MSVFFLVAFTLAFLSTAWVAEDAFITFRTVDNALGGLGLTWNPGERVQVYTHPLWMGLLVAGGSLFKDLYYVAIALSYLLLLLTLWLVARLVGKWTLGAAISVAALLFSRSFLDYSSSGLENPLIHAFLTLFLLVWFNVEGGFKSAILALIMSALFLARPDSVVLVLFALAKAFKADRKIVPILWGLLPAALWVGFSLFYYGAPVPNTALAKVGNGLSMSDNFGQAWNYFEWTYSNDMVSIALLVAGVVVGLLDQRLRVFAFGLLSWLIYIFYVGADYMAGRFLSGPVLLSAVLLAISAKKIPQCAVLLMMILNIGVLGKTIFSPSNFDYKVISDVGIADERGFYYKELGFLPSLYRGSWMGHRWLIEGLVIRQHPGNYTRCTIGMIAYMAGPGVIWTDPLALTEPFLARLPSRSGARVGHYERAYPPGFLDSVLSGKNLVLNPDLHALYDDVLKVARGNLSDMERIPAIWRLNTGHHRKALTNFDRNAIGLPGVPVVTRSTFSCFGTPYGGGETWKLSGPPAAVQRIEIRWDAP